MASGGHSRAEDAHGGGQIGIGRPLSISCSSAETVMGRAWVISRTAVQNGSSRLTLVLCRRSHGALGHCDFMKIPRERRQLAVWF